MEEDDEEDVQRPPPETVIEVEAPRIDIGLGSRESQLRPYFIKLPNFLSIEHRPFDPVHYEEENEDEDMVDEEGRNRLKLKCENTIRWRELPDENGEMRRQSNAKIVRWSDGSMSLHLGAEIFDVHMQPMQDHNHLFIRQGAGLQGQAVFQQKMTFRPHSIESSTHRKMTLNMAEREHRLKKAKVLALGETDLDPDKQKKEMVRREEERLRAAMRREAQQQRIRDRASMGGLSTGYLEQYDSDDGVDSMSALKRSYALGGREYERISSHRDRHGGRSDESDDEQNTSSEQQQRRVVSDSDESAPNSEHDDTASVDNSQSAADKKRSAIIEDDEDDD